MRELIMKIKHKIAILKALVIIFLLLAGIYSSITTRSSNYKILLNQEFKGIVIKKSINRGEPTLGIQDKFGIGYLIVIAPNYYNNIQIGDSIIKIKLDSNCTIIQKDTIFIIHYLHKPLD